MIHGIRDVLYSLKDILEVKFVLRVAQKFAFTLLTASYLMSHRAYEQCVFYLVKTLSVMLQIYWSWVY